MLIGTGYSLTPKIEIVPSGFIRPIICSIAIGLPFPPTHSNAWSVVNPSGTSFTRWVSSANVKSASLSLEVPKTTILDFGK